MLRTFIAVLLILWSSTAYAQKVVLFLKPTPGLHGEVTQQAWWVLDQPLYSSADRSLSKDLAARGITVLQPSDLSRISGVVRQSNLSDANARNLANLLGADIAIIGTIQHEVLKPLSVLPLEGVRISMDARIVDLKNSSTTLAVSTSRASFARQEELARALALDALADVLQFNIKTPRTRPEQPVGWASDFPQLHIAGLTRGAFHDAIRERLISHPLVAEVLTVWVAPGMIALKLVGSSREVLSFKHIDEVARSLMSETFEEFRLSMTTQPSPNTVELNVSATVP